MDISEPPPQCLVELKDILQKSCSFTIQFDEKPNNITKEQSLVVKDIEKIVNEDERMVGKIKKGVNEIFLNEIYLKKALLPTVLKKEKLTFAIEQESLIRLLLRVNQLQEPVFELLLEEMIKVCSDTEDCCMMRLLLNPLKYLPNINNAEGFSTKLLDLLELGSSELQLEMLDCIPDIIPDSCYDKVAEQLLRILSSGDSHREAIIGCFGAFDFSENVKEYIFGKLLDQIVPVHPDCFPATLKLLLNSHKGKISPKLFLKIRDMIHNIMTEPEHLARKVDIVNVIRTISNKGNIIQSCLELINTIKTSKEHKPFDLLILLILGEDTKYKELIRKKVEAGHFTPELVKNLVSDPTFALLNECLEALIKLAGYLLRYQSLKLKNFTVSLLNTVCSVNQQGANSLMITKEIVECLMKACYNSNIKCVHQALRIFHDLVVRYPDIFYDNWNKITGLLRKMEDFDLYATSMVYTIICHISSIVKPDNSQAEVMKNEISLVIRKQLMSSKRLRKSKGVIGSFVQLQMLVELRERGDCGNSENDEEQILELIEPLPADIVEASSIVESVCVLTEGIPECTGMFYDQCAQYFCRIISRRNFQVWMTRRLHELLKNYVWSSNEDTIEMNNMTFKPQYQVGESQGYVMNIGLMALEPHKYENSPLILLPSLFYLYRSLQDTKHLHVYLRRDTIFLFNCCLMLPDMENLDDLNCSQLKQVADILYHTINFLKELVAGTIWAETFYNTLQQRLNLLIKFETTFNDLLKRIPEHTFPQPYFNDCTKNKQVHEIKKKVVARKTKKRKVVQDESIASTSVLSVRDLNNTSSFSVLTSKAPRGPSHHSKYLIEHNINFREFNYMDLIPIIPFYNKLHYTSSSDEELTIKLDYSQLLYLLRNFVQQLRTLLVKQTEPKFFEATFTIEKVLNDLLFSMCYMMERFREIKNEIDALDLFDDENETHCDLMMCFWYFLEFFFIILSAKIEQPCKLMDEIHFCLDTDKEDEGTRNNLVDVFSMCFETSILLSQRVLIYQIIEKILDYQPTEDSTKIKSSLCDEIVKKSWGSSKPLAYSEKQLNQDTKFVLEKYFAGKKVVELHEFLAKVMEEHEGLTDRHSRLPSLIMINRSNFHILFVSLCGALQENVDKEVQLILKQNCSRTEHLKLWKNTTNSMFILMNIARNELTKHNVVLCTFLKKSIPILKLFIAQALPIFDMMFSSKTETVVEILKTLQSSTRFLHHLCCQSKTFKNLSVISHIPSFRLVLETLIYKVKALLVSHNCEDAFFLGNLKNKDIHGNTQTSEQIEEDITQENEQEDDDDILASDDESDGNMDDDRSESLTF